MPDHLVGNTVGVRLTSALRRPVRVTAGSAAVVGATLALASLGMMIAFFPLELPLPFLRRTLARMVMFAG